MGLGVIKIKDEGKDFMQKRCLNHLLEDNPALVLLGIEQISLRENGESEILVELKKEHTNTHGIVHGGIYATLMDTAMGVACFAGHGVSCVTLGMNTSFIANCQPGSTAVTVGRVLHAGRRTMVAESEVFDANGKLMAKSQGTFFVLGEHPKSEKKVQEKQV